MRFADWTQPAAACTAVGLIVLCPTVAATAASAAQPKRQLVGAVTFVSGSGVKVAGKNVSPGGKSPEATSPLRPLYAGDAVRTTESGWVQFRVQIGKRRAYCKTNPRRGWVVVSPKPSVFIDFRDGDTFCGTDPAGGQKPMGAGGHVTLAMEDPVFKVVVRGRQTVVKVHKGAIVVSGQEGSEKAVVLGRKQETRVPEGAIPSTPTNATFTKDDRQAFRQLDRALPPVTNKPPPKPILEKRLLPPDPSSLRSANFAFSAPEPATFSCALDGDDFRLCESPLAYPPPRLAPGPHTFRVRATDAAGNRGETAYSWTIDGSRIAYTRRPTKGEGPADIYVMDPDGENVLQFTDDGSSWDPAWSRDAERIVFHRGVGGNAEIWVMKKDGTDETQLTANDKADSNPTWSPDGAKIAFERGPIGDREVYVMNKDGTGETRLTSHPADDSDPAWSPDGTKIAFASTRGAAKFQIYVMDTDGSNVKRLVTSSGADFNPAWSPDGSKIAFHSNRDGISSKIYLMNANGMEQAELTHTASVDLNPVWAPDGQELVFQRIRVEEPDQIFMVNADGSGTLQLTDGRGQYLVPDW